MIVLRVQRGRRYLQMIFWLSKIEFLLNDLYKFQGSIAGTEETFEDNFSISFVTTAKKNEYISRFWPLYKSVK